jgi:FixJ family two-component response regulator
VYVVEDDSAVRAAVSLLVRTAGWEAVPCERVEDFLARYRPGNAQCVIADLCMPGRGGLDLQRELRRRGDGIPVIVMTAHGDQPEADLAKALGARAVLGKPFRDAELLGLLAEALEEGPEAP